MLPLNIEIQGGSSRDGKKIFCNEASGCVTVGEKSWPAETFHLSVPAQE
jgi:hypothetical protein